MLLSTEDSPCAAEIRGEEEALVTLSSRVRGLGGFAERRIHRRHELGCGGAAVSGEEDTKKEKRVGAFRASVGGTVASYKCRV